MSHPHDPLLIRGWRTARWGLLLAVLALGAVTIWLLPREGLDRPEGYGVGGARDHTAPTVGIGVPAAPTDEARPAADPDGLSRGVTISGTVRELQTITGLRDPNQLVGEQVELQVPVEQVHHHVVFWVGSPGDRVLVVMGRDTRDGAARQRGDAPDHTIREVHDADRIAIAGTIRRVPHAEAMFSWRLTRPEHAEVVNRGMYIEAHSVRPLGQVRDAATVEPGDEGATTADPRTDTAESADEGASTGEPADDRATAGERRDEQGEPAKGSALEIPAEPSAGCRYFLPRFARPGPLCGRA